MFYTLPHYFATGLPLPEETVTQSQFRKVAATFRLRKSWNFKQIVSQAKACAYHFDVYDTVSNGRRQG